LKGFGHGVRKIHSAGRHQAVIIHTATGKNLTELESKFADVGYSDRDCALGEPIENVRNIGPRSASWLRGAGINTIGDLRRLGPRLAFQMVKSKRPQVSLNLLWALAAGIENRDWRDLSAKEKKAFSDRVDPLD
jgi:nucleotidyltransferase/DNA polymerase involved in DNA repair